MQLVAYGAQDIYLTGNPMITYFKVVYRRHTNFAMESIAQTFSGSVGFGNKVSALISRNGDLVSGLKLEMRLPTLTRGAAGGNTNVRWIDDVGHHLIESVSVEIGGQLIDRHYGDWLEVWAQLSVPAGKRVGYRRMIGQDGEGVGLQDAAETGGNSVNPGQYLDENNRRILYVPLQFWFCRNVGLALPLIALQYHEVKLAVKFRNQNQVVTTGTGATTGEVVGGSLDATLWADYIYLDTDERRRFAQVSHEYLIEQLQFTGDNSFESETNSIPLHLNHPVKELIWVSRFSNKDTALQWSNYTTRTAADDETNTNPEGVLAAGDNAGSYGQTDGLGTGPTDGVALNPTKTAQLHLNGHERFATQRGPYFNLLQTKNHHTNIPLSPGINVYSFALKPEDHQPSGTCNFSRIDNAHLNLRLRGEGEDTPSTNGVTKVFAVNYNVLRIMSGMGGLAYSN